MFENHWSIAVKVTADLNDRFANPVSTKTVHRELQKSGCIGRSVITKILLFPFKIDNRKKWYLDCQWLTGPTKSSNRWKAPGIGQSEVVSSSIRTTQDFNFLYKPGRYWYRLVEISYYIRRTLQTLNLRITTYFNLYKILLMERFQILWMSVETAEPSSLFKKMPRSGNHEVASKIAKVSGWLILCINI